MSEARYRDARVGGCVAARVDVRPDGITFIESTEPLGWHPPRLTDCLEQWAREAPQRTFVARRDRGGDWVRIGYAQMLDRARRVGQALLDHGVSVERPLAIL